MGSSLGTLGWAVSRTILHCSRHDYSGVQLSFGAAGTAGELWAPRLAVRSALDLVRAGRAERVLDLDQVAPVGIGGQRPVRDRAGARRVGLAALALVLRSVRRVARLRYALRQDAHRVPP